MGIKKASKVEVRAARVKVRRGKVSRGSFRLRNKMGISPMAKRMAANGRAGGAIIVPPRMRDKNGRLVKGKRTSRSAQSRR